MKRPKYPLSPQVLLVLELPRAMAAVEDQLVIRAWRKKLLSTFVKQMEGWSDDEKHSLGEKLENLKNCCHELVSLQLVECGEVDVMLRQVELFCSCARMNLQDGSPEEIPDSFFSVRGVCGPQRIKDPYRSFKQKWEDLGSRRLEVLTEDLREAMRTIREYMPFFQVDYLLEEAMQDTGNVFQDVYFLGMGVLTYADL